YEEGSGPSAEQSFTVEGSNLTNNISLSAPTNYEISETSGSGFGNSVTLTQSGGTVSTTTIYVRLKAGLSIATYNNEDITASSSDATDQTVTCDGEVVCPSVSAPTATAASSLSGTSFTANWNLVSVATGYYLDVYSSGGEGPELVLNGGFETGDNSYWTTFETNYQVVTSDGSVTPHAGSYMLKCFATDTRVLAQDITIAADGTTQYGISFWYRYETASDPEKLRIWSNFSLGHSGDDIQPTTYLNATDTWTQVTYTVTPSAGSNTLNLELRSYSSGKVYLDDISFKATGGGTTYHLQDEDVGNVTSYNVTGLTAGETYYYVVRAYNDCGNTSGNSNEITVITPCSAPTTEATNLVFSNVGTDQMDISWTNGDGDYRLVVASTSAITGTPSDNTTYSADAAFNNGQDELNAGEYVVYAGNGNSFTMTGLDSDTEYFIKVFEYNCDSGNEQYLTTSLLSGSENTEANIPAVSDFDVTCMTETTATVEWTNPSSGDWDGVAIAVRRGTNPPQVLSGFAAPSALTVNTAFGNAGSEYGNSPDYSYAIYKGAGTSITVTGLTQGEDYVFKAFSYYNDAYDNSNGVTTTSITDLDVEDVSSASATTENAQTSINWSNTQLCYDEIMIVGHEGSSVTSTPIGDGSSYTANTVFGSGTDIGSNEFVVYKGTSSGVTVTGLTNGITYYFTIFSRVGNEWSDGVEVWCIPQTVTSFEPGDLAIIAVNTNHATIGEEFTFVSFVDITEGTAIDFTDNGWQQENPDRWGTTEGTIRLTRISGGTLSAGTSVTVIMNAGNGDDQPDFDVNVAGVDELGTNWSILLLNSSEGTGFNLNAEDEIWMLQGGSWIENDITSADPINDDDEYTGYVLYGWTATGWGTGESTKKSDLYPGTECFNTNVSGMDYHAKVKYTGPMTDANKLEWIMRFNDTTLWDGYIDDGNYDAATPKYRQSGININIVPGDFEPGRWIAAEDQDWFYCGNWQNLIVPDETTDVLVSTTYASGDAVVDSSDNALCHDLTIESGIGIDYSDGNHTNNTIEIHGDLLNQSAGTNIISTGGKMLFASEETAEITTNGALLYDVEFDGTGEFSLLDDMNVDGIFTLTDGIVSTGTNKVHVQNTGAGAISGHSAASYINGNLRRDITGAGLYDLPVGNGTFYELASLDITTANNLSYIDVFFENSDLGAINISGLNIMIDGTLLTSVLDAGYWQVEPDAGLTSIDYDIILNETGATNAASLAEQHAVIKRPDALSDWTFEGTHDNATQAINGSVVTAQVSSLTGFSQFAIARNSQWPLAIELVDFKVSCHPDGLLAEWITASEENSDYFCIQYSSDGRVWETMKKHYAFGTTNTQQNYHTLLENAPADGYYRLTEVDMNGKVTAYAPQYINCDSQGDNTVFMLYPNPASQYAQLSSVNSNADHYKVAIINANGKTINTLNWEHPDETPLMINTENITSGMYIIRIYNETEMHHLQFNIK
ncbi:MAG: T9SS type A sorting domain-containing protein, partial [Bacteroidota bacterium]|nr:T9SS type A sorting domain-containing protein [Bacteroidota bacterium]